MTEVRRTNPPPAHLDHLIVAATTLADGIELVAEVTGATPPPGGKHVAMGTHNALLRLGERVYLEVIAIDPDGENGGRAGSISTTALRSSWPRPQLVQWVARSTDVERAAAACAIPLGTGTPMERGDYRWRITIPEDGKRPGKGIVPTLIQWDVPMHPADRLPQSNVSIAQLAATHRDPSPVRGALSALGLADIVQVSYDRETRLAAMLRTPRGLVTL
jgi:hypothetical protein